MTDSLPFQILLSLCCLFKRQLLIIALILNFFFRTVNCSRRFCTGLLSSILMKLYNISSRSFIDNYCDFELQVKSAKKAISRIY